MAIPKEAGERLRGMLAAVDERIGQIVASLDKAGLSELHIDGPALASRVRDFAEVL